MRANKNYVIFNIAVLILMLVATLYIYKAFNSKAPGRRIMSVPIEKRVSYRYITKSVLNPTERRVVFGETGYEDGSANLVTSIVVNYRAFDTLLEVIILFTATAGVLFLMRGRKRTGYSEASLIVKTGIPIINLFVAVTGIVIILQGHLTPGGGFPGGAVVASGFFLSFLAYKYKANKTVFLILETIGGLGIIIVGLLGLFLKLSFLENFMPLGPIGGFFSSGIVLILYILIGIKVSSEISNIGIAFVSHDEKEGL